MVVSDAGTTRAAGAIGFVTQVTNVTAGSAGGYGPATLATPAPLWPRERPNSRQNGHEKTAGVAKATVAWPRRRCRGQGDAAVAKATLPWPRRRCRGQGDGAVAKATVPWPKMRMALAGRSRWMRGVGRSGAERVRPDAESVGGRDSRIRTPGPCRGRPGPGKSPRARQGPRDP